jgi:hypothetical protein
MLMVGGGVALAVALFVFLGRDGDEVDEQAALANRCAFPACRAAANPGQARGYEGQSVAVDPASPDHVVVTDANMTEAACGWHVTFDRGRKWEDGVFVTPDGYTACHINAGSGGHVPTGPGGVAFGPSGKVYATFGSAHVDDNKRESVILAISDDGGKKWRTTVAARPPGEDIGYARPQMSVAQGPGGQDRVLLSFWLCRERGRFCDSALFARSDDGGATFTPPVVLNDPPAGQTPSEPLQTPDGTVYVTFARRFADGPTDLMLARSNDGGSTFTYSRIESQPLIGDRYDPGKLAFDPRSGAMYVVYTDSRIGRQQVFFRKSTDKGTTWSDVIGLSPDRAAAGSSRSPTISIAPNGRIDIVYYRTLQADTDDIFWAHSVDGGLKFLTRQVNDRPIRRFDFARAIGNWYPPDVASTDDAALVVWSDTRNFPDQIASTQDVFLRRMLPAGGEDGDLPP